MPLTKERRTTSLTARRCRSSRGILAALICCSTVAGSLSPLQPTAAHTFNPNRVLSKAQILDHVWQYDFDGDSNILETYISYIRKKVNALGPPLIQTVRLVGYVLREVEPAVS